MVAVAESQVFIAIDASGILFKLYLGSIIKKFCGTTFDYGVLIVSNGIDDGENYWLVRNS